MQIEELLVVHAEVAAAFAGFSGVVSALGNRSVVDVDSVIRYRFTNLLIISIAATFFALFPLVIMAMSAAPGVVWSLSSACLLSFCLAVLLFRVREGAKYARSSVRLWVAACFIVVLSLVVAVQFANLIAWPVDRNGAQYVFGVFGLIVLAGIQFYSLALPMPPASHGDAAAQPQASRHVE